MDIAVYFAVLLGGIGVFIAGMEYMSKGLENIAGKGMQKVLFKISNNRFLGFGIGAVLTAIIQSSSATTVMSISLVNASVMSFAQAASIIVGANVGTTATAFITALSGFSFKIGAFLGTFALVGVLMKIFSKRENLILLGDILLGLGLIFIGLELMGSAFNDEQVKNIFKNIFTSINFPLLLLLIGTVVTAILQSSSATTGIVIAMAGSGAIDLNQAFYIILGANIGTCITGVIAAFNSSSGAKKVALFQIIFNIFGVLIFMPLTLLFESQVEGAFKNVLGDNITFQIAFYHLFFNALTAIVVLPLLKYFLAFINIIIKDKESQISELKLNFIDDLILNTPSIALIQIKKEILRMLDIANENLKFSMEALLSKDLSKNEIISKNEDLINFLNKSIASYLIKLSLITLSEEDERRIGSFHHVINDIERIGDHADDFYEILVRMIKEDLYFSDQGFKEITIMYNIIKGMYDITIEVFKDENKSLLPQISALEKRIDKYELETKDNYIKRIKENPDVLDLGPYFFSVTAGLERIGDHLTNIAYTIKSPVGEE